MTPDQLVRTPGWSEPAAEAGLHEIDHERMRRYRLERIRAEARRTEVDLVVLLSPISLRYAVDHRNYALFQAHIPTTYLFVSPDGPTVLHGAYGTEAVVDEHRPARALAFFDGGHELEAQAELLAGDVARHLNELGSGGGRVAIEYVNPSITQALARQGMEVVDGVSVVERARMIKSDDEIGCIRWAIAVAEHGIRAVERAAVPGVTETQLWALLNYVNIANNGDWHDGRMLASGPRTNPWLQEASPRLIEAGDLVAFDTDMVGPHGYSADISRTVVCGSGLPTPRQRELYQLAVAEIEHNIALLRPGLSLTEFQRLAFPVPEEFQAQAYTCVFHGIGMCDEYPQAKALFRGPNPYDCRLEAGMVLCVESYMGAVGEPDGVKLEQMVLITDDGSELLSTHPLDERFS